MFHRYFLQIVYSELVEQVCSVLGKDLSLWVLSSVLPIRLVFGQTQRRFDTMGKDKWTKINFCKKLSTKADNV